MGCRRMYKEGRRRERAREREQQPSVKRFCLDTVLPFFLFGVVSLMYAQIDHTGPTTPATETDHPVLHARPRVLRFACFLTHCTPVCSRRHSSGGSTGSQIEGFDPLDEHNDLIASDSDNEDLTQDLKTASDGEEEEPESPLDEPGHTDADSSSAETLPNVPLFSDHASTSSSNVIPHFIAPAQVVEIEQKRQAALLKLHKKEILDRKARAARLVQEKKKESVTTAQPFSTSSSSSSSSFSHSTLQPKPKPKPKPKSKSKRKRKRKRTSLTPVIIARRRRCIVTRMAGFQFEGNNRLNRVQILKATLIAKDGHLSKQGINRWSHGFGDGPTYATVKKVYGLLAAHGKDELVADLNGRAAAGISHANRPAAWVVCTLSCQSLAFFVRCVLPPKCTLASLTLHHSL